MIGSTTLQGTTSDFSPVQWGQFLPDWVPNSLVLLKGSGFLEVTSVLVRLVTCPSMSLLVQMNVGGVYWEAQQPKPSVFKSLL